MESLTDAVKKDFNFLFKDNGFSLVQSGSEDMPPSYALIILQKGNIRLRFIKDRADFFLDVGLADRPEEWCDIYDILGMLKAKGLINEEVKAIHKSDAIKRILKEYNDLIKEFPTVFH